ncbi:MAG: RHS repeat protein, partial [Hymenobacter sp.]
LITDPDGATLRRAYDAQDQLVKIINAVGAQWQRTYDLAGNQVAETDPLGLLEQHDYVGGLLHRLVSTAGQVTDFVYDLTGNLLEVQRGANRRQRWLYDQWGRVRKFTDERGNVQWREYDLLNRVTVIHEPDGNVRSFIYDGLNNVIRSTDRQHDVQYAYRGLSRLIRRVEAGTATEFLHDTEEQLRAIVNEHGLTYRFELDRQGAVTKETGFDGLIRHYKLDAGGRVLTVTLPTGQQTRYAYDKANRLTQVVYADGNIENFTYRLDGMLLAATNNTLAVTFERDIVGNVLREIQGAHTVISVYNAQGQRDALTSSLGASVRYTRDQAGRVAQVQAGKWQALIERDAQGLELQRTLSGGVRTQWRHNALGLPVEQRISAGWSRPERMRTYHWQEADRLTQIQDNQSGLTRFTHDAVGNLAVTVFSDGTMQLRQPDLVGNLFATPDRQDRRYGPAGQLLEALGTRYTYDATGNLIGKITPQGQEWRYSWQAGGHLAEVVRPDGKIV